MAQRFSCCSTVLATTRAIWPHRMIALHRCQRQLNPQRPIPVRLNHHTGMLQKRILVRREVARRGTRAPSALRRRRAVLLYTPGPPRHMLKVRKQMGVGRQSTLSDQLLLLGLLQLVVAARSNKQREKKQTHWPGHRRIPRQVPHAIQVFPEEFVPNGDVLFHLPHLRQSLLPVLCHKPRAIIDVQRRSGLPLQKLRRSPHRTAQPHKIGLRLHVLRQSWVIRAEFFQRLRKLLHALRKESMTVGAPVHIFLIHQLLPLRVLTQTIPTGLIIQVILQRHQVIKQTLTCALVHQRRYHDTAPINDDPHRIAAAVGAPN
ncbi:hypothetical protein TcG_11160 [Trypanosoma cruzi]|nr:hypothetical protein TcG_11160 [Trypanosoma cruzi]